MKNLEEKKAPAQTRIRSDSGPNNAVKNNPDTTNSASRRRSGGKKRERGRRFRPALDEREREREAVLR